ncbi:MAG: hypothetical protein B6I19_05195 [Bacteroidetes bacterium 4572_114]|nr:MAG: hypothetical protein B6I19_05195 [Bacteroidetes bacterium 4572_114]
MLDTPKNIQKKQFEILMSKSMEERLIIGLETIDFAMTIAESSIKQEHPGISETDLKIALLKRFYSNQFTTETLNKIIASTIIYYNSK